MKDKISRFFPVGYPLKQEILLFCGMFTAAVLSTMLYFSKFTDAYNGLFKYVGDRAVLVESRIMPDFFEIADGCFVLFRWVIMLAAVNAFLHYAYHYRESKSIYLMKRLPQKHELHFRCLVIPATAVVLTLVTAMLLLVAFRLHYLSATPEQCLIYTEWTWRLFLRSVLS